MNPSSQIWRASEPLIDAVFARCVRGNNRGKVFFLVFAGLCLVAGAGFSVNDKEHIRIPGMIAALFCFLMTGGFGFYFVIKPPEERFAKIKARLRDKPEDLVWSYILEQRTNGIPSWFVVMKFRCKEEVHIHRRSLPNKDMEGFIGMLSHLNPRMHVGYSEELKKMYKRGEM